MSENTTIWVCGTAQFCPKPYYFKNGMVTYYIEDGRLFAQVYKVKTHIINNFEADIVELIKTEEIFEGEDRSMKELIDE